MTDQEQEDELLYALHRERAWRKLMGTMDCGSYCESAATDAKSAGDIRQLYASLSAALMSHERNGFKFPGATG